MKKIMYMGVMVLIFLNVAIYGYFLFPRLKNNALAQGYVTITRTGQVEMEYFHPDVDGYWKPGKEVSKHIKFMNDLNVDVEIVSMGGKITLRDQKDHVLAKENQIFEDFNKNMVIKIEKVGIWNENIFGSGKGVTFKELLENPDLKNKFIIPAGDMVQLKFTVRMREEAGNNLQGLTAHVKFIANNIPVQRNNGGHKEEPKLPIEKPLEIPPTPSYEDTTNHWAMDAINSVSQKGIMTGDHNGNFRPEEELTRNDSAKAMVLALGLALEEPDEAFEKVFCDYEDIPKKYRSYIYTAYKHHLIEGYGDSYFRGNHPITEMEFGYIVDKAFDQRSHRYKEELQKEILVNHFLNEVLPIQIPRQIHEQSIPQNSMQLDENRVSVNQIRIPFVRIPTISNSGYHQQIPLYTSERLYSNKIIKRGEAAAIIDAYLNFISSVNESQGSDGQ